MTRLKSPALVRLAGLACTIALAPLAVAGVNQIHVDQLPVRVPRLSIEDARPRPRPVETVDRRPAALRKAVGDINSSIEAYRIWAETSLAASRNSMAQAIQSATNANTKQTALSSIDSIEQQMSRSILERHDLYRAQIYSDVAQGYGGLFADENDAEWIGAFDAFVQGALVEMAVIRSHAMHEIRRLATDARDVLYALPY